MQFSQKKNLQKEFFRGRGKNSSPFFTDTFDDIIFQNILPILLFFTFRRVLATYASKCLIANYFLTEKLITRKIGSSEVAEDLCSCVMSSVNLTMSVT